MVWKETVGDEGTVIYQQEPGAIILQQLTIAVIGLLPIESLL